jgi:hypothetical protein
MERVRYSRDPYASVQVHLTMTVKQTRFTGVRNACGGEFRGWLGNLVLLPQAQSDTWKKSQLYYKEKGNMTEKK